MGYIQVQEHFDTQNEIDSTEQGLVDPTHYALIN
jgi:hypothetical protein